VAIFIDGGNFYQRLREAGLQRGVKFDYPGFIKLLLRGRTPVSQAYYIGIVRNHDQTEQSQKRVADQQKFLGKLEAEGFAIKRGRIVYDHKIREKGVDVQIAIDVVTGAADDLYDTAVIVSSDTDLVPAVKYVRAKGKQVEYVGFSARPSLGMARESSLSILLLPEDIKKLSDEEGGALAA
jgi:uncharacterized LabA/DUF88 family protein